MLFTKWHRNELFEFVIIQKTSIENDEPVQSTHILYYYFDIFLIQLTYVTVS